MFRRVEQIEFLLAHPGGPYYKNKDLGAWGIPKGHAEDTNGVEENLLLTAQREFTEETNIEPIGPYIELGQIKYSKGKIVYGWAFESRLTEPQLSQQFKSNLFTMEWPPKSNEFQEFPEIDKISWFCKNEAITKVHPAQIPFIERLIAALK